jgi:predicted Zn-dependent protease
VRRRTLRILGLGLALALAFALPVAADDEPQEEEKAKKEKPKAPDLSTPYADERVGESEAKKVGAQIGLVDDPELNAYVQAVGARLARNAPGHRFTYRFAIVDAEEPNAFALPGGYIFVSRGLLALTNSEDELANVLGHEIAHVAQRHSAAQLEVGGAGIGRAFKAPYLASYSRDLERSADRVGQGIAAVAGYDPAGMREFMLALDRMERVRFGSSRIPGYLATHPGSRSRAAEAGQRAETTSWTRVAGVSSGREDHMRRLEGIVVGQSAPQGVFVGNRFLQPDLGFTIRFPDGWDTANTPAAVGAVSPHRDTQVFLEISGKGKDAEKAAEAWMKEGGKSIRVEQKERVKITGRPGVRISGSAKGAGFITTFVSFRGFIYQITGLSKKLKRNRDLVLQVARSFRPMTPELLRSVHEDRLQIVAAEPGETLKSLSARTNNSLDLRRLAAMNAIQPGTALEGGQLVKVTVAVPYKPPGVAHGPARPGDIAASEPAQAVALQGH